MDNYTTYAELGAPERFRIIEGREYIYCGGRPVGCRGHRYRVVKLITAVPAYQQLVLVEALTGPDIGKLFACTPANFSARYVEVPPALPLADSTDTVVKAEVSAPDIKPAPESSDSVTHPCGCISYEGSEGFRRQRCQKHLGRRSVYPLFTKGA